MSLKDSLKKAIESLSPAYFALVMATGIISMASHLVQAEQISNTLFWINNIFFFILLILLLIRLGLFFPNIVTDLSTHAKGAGFLTVVAGSCILGTQYSLLKHNYVPAQVLWFFSLALWLVLIYAFLSLVILNRKKPSPEKGLDGTWLLLIVSTQSISILGGALAFHLPFTKEVATFISVFTFLLGVMLYLIVIPIIFYRLVFFPVGPEEVTPPYWINMGAAAITTLAGAMLTQSIRADAVFNDFFFFIKGATLLFWTISSFWIPLVLILEIWRYGYKRSPINYQSSYWSLVFPLGVYTVSTWRLAEVLSLPFLKSFASGFIYVPWLAWMITFLGMCISLIRLLSGTLYQNKKDENIRETFPAR